MLQFVLLPVKRTHTHKTNKITFSLFILHVDFIPSKSSTAYLLHKHVSTLTFYPVISVYYMLINFVYQIFLLLSLRQISVSFPLNILCSHYFRQFSFDSATIEIWPPSFDLVILTISLAIMTYVAVPDNYQDNPWSKL